MTEATQWVCIQIYLQYPCPMACFYGLLPYARASDIATVCSCWPLSSQMSLHLSYQAMHSEHDEVE